MPIIETQAGDVSAYIPTNVISITDGQVYLEPSLFFSGIRPAINVGLSVSRVGGAAQVKAMKQVAGTLKLDLAQYRELASFAQFEATWIKRPRLSLIVVCGCRNIEATSVSADESGEEVVVLFAGTRGFLDKYEVEKIKEYEPQVLAYMKSKHQDIMQEIDDKKVISPELEQKIKEALTAFDSMFVAG